MESATDTACLSRDVYKRQALYDAAGKLVEPVKPKDAPYDGVLEKPLRLTGMKEDVYKREVYYNCCYYNPADGR